MHPLADNRSPVHNYTGYGIVMEHHVFYGIAVENSRTGFRRTIDQSRGCVHGIHNISTVSGILITYTQLTHDRHSLFLNHDIVEHHGAAPHTSTRSQLTVEQSHLFSGLSQIISGNDTRRTATDNSDINRQIAL